jgi:putative colanic acid biosynthesis acetyltransferase WcaF
MELGDYVCLGDGVDFYCVSPIKLGSKVAISQRSFLCTASHDISLLTRPLIHKSIHIQDHVWVCAQAFVGPGITVGEGAIIGACAVVTKDVEPWTVVAGNPARVIKQRKLNDNGQTTGEKSNTLQIHQNRNHEPHHE